MIRIGILGDIGAGKSYVAKNFGYPVFNADREVALLYKNNKKIFNKLKKKLPKYIYSFPIDKKEILTAILAEKNNLNKIIKIVHLEIRKKLNFFLKKNRAKNIIVLDIPLLLENKLNNKKDILIYIESKKFKTIKQLEKRKNFNQKLIKNLEVFNYQLVLKRKNLNLLSKTILLQNVLEKV